MKTLEGIGDANMNVVITGASSGIGRALVKEFARNGHAVLAVARRQGRLLELCKELEGKYQARVYPLSLDITAQNAERNSQT